MNEPKEFAFAIWLAQVHGNVQSGRSGVWGRGDDRDVDPAVTNPHGRERGHSTGMPTGRCPLLRGTGLLVETLKCLEETESEYEAQDHLPAPRKGHIAYMQGGGLPPAALHGAARVFPGPFPLGSTRAFPEAKCKCSLYSTWGIPGGDPRYARG